MSTTGNHPHDEAVNALMEAINFRQGEVHENLAHEVHDILCLHFHAEQQDLAAKCDQQQKDVDELCLWLHTAYQYVPAETPLYRELTRQMTSVLIKHKEGRELLGVSE